MTKKLTVFGILILTITVSFTGCLEDNENDNSEIQLKEEVIVTTDKTEYETGQSVVITLTNNLNHTIFYISGFQYCSEVKPFKVYILSENTWDEVTVSSWDCDAADGSGDPIYKPLNSTESVSIVWDQKQWIDPTGLEQVNNGRYKISLSYTFSTKTRNYQEVFSNEFTVGPTKEVIITTDKTEYLPTENVNFTILNNLNESIYLIECKPLHKQDYIHIPFIEKRNDDVWQNVQYQPVCEKRKLIEITPKSEEKFNLSYNLESPGTYRLNFFVRLDCEDSIERYGWDLEKNHGESICAETINFYSNEFTVNGFENILLETDKEQYITGENVSITVSNNMEDNIGVKDIFHGIEILKNGNWTNLWDYTGHNCSCDVTCFWGSYPVLESMTNMTVIWNQKMWDYCDVNASFLNLGNSTFIFTPEGRYRIFATVGYQDFTDEIYSNEFTIN